MNTKIQTELSNFMDLFAFKAEKAGFVGCEREVFTADNNLKIMPWAKKFLDAFPNKTYGYELSACQVEFHIGPVRIKDFQSLSNFIHEIFESNMAAIGMIANYTTVAPDDMPLDVFPDPTGRYQSIVPRLSRDELLAACRVAGTHFHIGMPDHEVALRVYNHVAEHHFDEICKMGNLNNGKRLEIYKVVSGENRPKTYQDWQDLYNNYKQRGCTEDPRQCWDLIRISKHGTIEFRMFDNTRDLKLLCNWASLCHNACCQVM